MAQVFPLNPDPSDAGRAALIRTLAGLPDEWTLLCARRVGDEPTHDVDAVLIHPEIGIALIDLAPGDPGIAVDPLRQQLEREGFGQYFSGDLPIVALSIAEDAVEGAGERLADAFEAAPLLSIGDADWADAVIELLMVPDDMAMAGPGDDSDAADVEAMATADRAFDGEGGEAAFAAGSFAPPRPEESEEREAAPLPEVDEGELPLRLVAGEPVLPLYHRRSRSAAWAAAAAAVLIVALGVGAWQLEEHGLAGRSPATGMTELQVPITSSPADAPASAEGSQAADQPPLPPVRLATKDFAKPPPLPPTPTRIEPLPPPKPPVELAAKTPAGGPPPPPKPTPIEPLPQRAAPAAVAETGAGTAASSGAPPRAPERQATVAPPPRQKPRRAAADEAPARSSTERQPDRSPVREARAHPPIDAGDLPPLEEGASLPPPVEPPSAAGTAPPSSSAGAATPPTAPIGPPVRLFGPPGAPAPLGGSTAQNAANAPAGNGTTSRECRPYTAETTLTGSRAPVQGIACRGSDGQWRLVSEVPSR